MNKIIILAISVLGLIGCGNTVQNTAPSNSPSNVVTKSDGPPTATGHSNQATASNQAANSTAKPEGGSRWSQSGDPIDTTQFDADIAKAEKNLKAKPKDETAKRDLAEAYFKRGEALTEARQYASALGDYRRVLKYDGDYDAAKTWIDQITRIYKSMNREAPKEGEEPKPLPYKKEAKSANSNVL